MKFCPVLRFGSVEAKLLLNELNGRPILPLIEAVKDKAITDFSGPLVRRYSGDYMVDLPFYLLSTATRTTRYSRGIEEIINSIPQNSATSNLSIQTRFYLANRKWVKIPVASAGEDVDESYDQVLTTYNELKNDFPRVAVKIFISHISLTPRQLGKLDVIFKNLREGDIILLDLIGFEGIEQQVLDNIDQILKLLPKKNEKYLLNAFDIRTNTGEVHNYGPLLAKQFNFEGFGDLCTSIRYESAAGRQGRKIIRYYVGDCNNKLLHVPHDHSFSAAFSALRHMGYWTNAVSRGHNRRCIGCQYAETSANGSQTFWKNYRILHYVFSILNDTLPNAASHHQPQDVDPDGYANLYNKTKEKL